MKRPIILVLALSALFALQSPFAQSQELIFKSGFENNTTPDKEDLTRFTGTDLSFCMDWVNDLDNHPRIGNFRFEYTGGTLADRHAKIIVDPENPDNQILEYWNIKGNADNGNARVQASLYGNNDLPEIYQKVRMYLHPDFSILTSAAISFDFFTIAEFWNNTNWTQDDHPFRVSLNMRKLSGVDQPLTFLAEAQTDLTNTSNWRTEWAEENNDFNIPIGKWMTTEIYFKEGDANNGRFYFAVTPDGEEKTVIFDLTTLTHHPDDDNPDGLSDYNPMKLYTSSTNADIVRNAGGALRIYWDDWELWKGGIPTTSAPVITDVPAEPTGLKTKKKGFTQIELNWNDNADETAYIIERKISDGNFEELVTVTKNSIQYVDVNLEDNQNYTYRLKAENCYGISVASEESTFFLEDDIAIEFTPEEVTASSLLGIYGPDRAIDADLSTYWLVEGANQWLQLELNTQISLSRVIIAFDNGESRLYNFEIQTSTDGENWSSAGFFSNSGLTNKEEEYSTTKNEARYVRFVTGSNSQDERTWLSEIEVWGEPSTLILSVIPEQPLVKVYPNPLANGNLIIDSKEMKQAEIYDIGGQLIRTVEITSSTQSIDISSLRKGIYLLKVSSASSLFVSKIVVP